MFASFQPTGHTPNQSPFHSQPSMYSSSNVTSQHGSNITHSDYYYKLCDTLDMYNLLPESIDRIMDESCLNMDELLTDMTDFRAYIVDTYKDDDKINLSDIKTFIPSIKFFMISTTVNEKIKTLKSKVVEGKVKRKPVNLLNSVTEIPLPQEDFNIQLQRLMVSRGLQFTQPVVESVSPTSLNTPICVHSKAEIIQEIDNFTCLINSQIPAQGFGTNVKEYIKYIELKIKQTFTLYCEELNNCNIIKSLINKIECFEKAGSDIVNEIANMSVKFANGLTNDIETLQDVQTIEFKSLIDKLPIEDHLQLLNKYHYQFIFYKSVYKNSIGDIEQTPQNKCNICLDSGQLIFIDVCGHTMCESCSKKISTCPTCRKSFTTANIKKIYIN